LTKKDKDKIKKYFILVILFLCLAFVLFPFFWMISAALKQPGNALKLEFWPKNGFSSLYTFSNFTKVFTEFNFGYFFLNSFIVAFFAATLATLFAAMAGYVFAKKEFYGKKFIFYFLIGTMMIPGMMYMVPQFMIVIGIGKLTIFGINIGSFLKEWHIMGYNTYGAMIIPHIASVFGVFLLKQYITTIPDAIIESAKIDGASEWQIFRVVILPLSLPVVTTLFLLTFLFHWSNFVWQLVITSPDSMIQTLPVGLAYFQGPYGNEYELMMAAACVSLIPISILFLLAQKFFIEGMTQGAVKG
jgi:multiple sugar transport system permease protein